MTQITELKNGIDKFTELRNIITDDDIEIQGIKIMKELFEFIEKVEKRISNKKRIDLYCYDEAHTETIYEPSKAQEGWVIVGINENGICSRVYKRSHMWKIYMVNQSWHSTSEKAQLIIDVLKNTDNKWIYDNLNDEATKEVLQKYIAFLDKHYILLNNADSRNLKYTTIKNVKLPTEFLNCINYKGNYEVMFCNITNIKFNTNNFQYLSLETDVKRTNDIRPPEQIDLRDYKHYYLTEQNYNEFKRVLTEIKLEIKDKIKNLNVLFKDLGNDVEQLKGDLGHIFVLDAI
jgi:hypothetical protein